jgi:hypothetical protein
LRHSPPFDQAKCAALHIAKSRATAAECLSADVDYDSKAKRRFARGAAMALTRNGHVAHQIVTSPK